ncbi:hypothetical protein SC65A3_02067 [Psychrobacter sp. SC65A.3]|uniref:hypothetical protein n=1 Tax=Psychrobacter sp. SC65A.3 TaxID=2983299 RepID=UPI0021DAE995|nr:hypothetical protein [Psychrobacter sp. SC65A.3]WAI88591.1 hypothetical protein SC65A3_02067 [Psychrobacter sp. SC65A.3]
MVNSREGFSDADLQKILEQAERIEFERLQHRTTIPTVFIKELLDSPPNFLLSRHFFDVGYKDRKRISIIHELIEKIENIAIEDCKGLLEEQGYRVDFEKEESIMYRGLSVHIMLSNKDIYLESKELKCLNFHKLCDCINLVGYVFGAGTNEVRGDNDFQKKLSKSNKTKANKRWSKHNQTRPEKKKLYLEIMDQQNFTTFAETAEYIKQHIETDKKPSYDTIKRWLSQANKGDFS